MAFLKGNTYVDGDLIVDGNITVGSLSSKGVAFTQLVNPEDNKLAVTTSDGNLRPSAIRETTSGNTATYDLSSISEISTSGNPLTVNSSSVTLNVPVDEIVSKQTGGQLYWEYKDGRTYSAADYPTGARPGTFPKEYPIGVRLQ